MARRKLGLVGAGNIGTELANVAVTREVADVILYDIPAKEGLSRGKALDLEQMTALNGSYVRVWATSDFRELSESAVLIVTAGIPRKPGQSRADLVATNLPIIRDVACKIRENCPNAFVIVLSNPLDAMVWELRRVTGFPPERVVGMAGMLDSARLSLFIARELGVSIQDVRTMVLGGHGDDMVPLLQYCSVNGVPVRELLPEDKLEAMVQRTRVGGGEIVQLAGTSAYYAPAAAALAMAEAYWGDRKRLLPAAAYVQGEYGYRDLYLGVPIVLGRGGVEKIIELDLTEEERELFDKSAKSVASIVEEVKRTSIAPHQG
jgi:malate dehydrogenase